MEAMKISSNPYFSKVSHKFLPSSQNAAEPAISFGAKYISSTQVQKISCTNTFNTPVKVSCVELDPKNKEDVEAAMSLYDLWESDERYEELVGLNMYASFQDELFGDVRFYVLTEQADNLDNLNPSEIVALSQVVKKDDKNVEIEYLQAKPRPRMIFPDSCVIKYAGTEMLNLIKNVFKGCRITLFSNKYTPDFYKKNGFKEDEIITNKFIFNA